MMKCLVETQFPEGISAAILTAFERSKDVFSSTKISLLVATRDEGAAELAPSGNHKRSR